MPLHLLHPMRLLFGPARGSTHTLPAPKMGPNPTCNPCDTPRWSPLHGTFRLPSSAALFGMAACAAPNEGTRSQLATALGRWGGGRGRGGGWEGGGGGDGSAQPQCEVAAGGLGPASEIVLTLASFAVTKLAYVRVTRAFREAYARQSGRDVRFRLTFAASGVQVGWAGAGVPTRVGR